ncbi:MAG: AMP-binding protein [Acidimicrobiales bacterium]
MSYASRIRALAAAAAPDATPVTVVARDGHVTPLTWRRLDADSNRLARALTRRGAGVGDRIGLELPNSPEMVTGVLAAWKIGAAPVPVRWDLPEWERNRVAQVLDAAVLIRPEDMAVFDEAAAEPDGALADVVGPAVNGICSSGSTGTPKIIMDETPAVFDPALAQPFPGNWGVRIGAQRILVPTALYHTNGFATSPTCCGETR